MAAFRDDMPLIAGVNEDWDENTTGTQIMRPDWAYPNEDNASPTSNILQYAAPGKA